MANQNNPKVIINLKGLAIGDGLCDPENVWLFILKSMIQLTYQ